MFVQRRGEETARARLTRPFSGKQTRKVKLLAGLVYGAVADWAI